MRYAGLPSLENAIRLTGNKGEYTFKKISVPVPGESLRLEGLFCTPAKRSGYYYAIEHPKERIVLHYTAGHLGSDLGALTRDHYHVSVAFVIARDGTIYQLFPSKYWSGHIGKGIGNDGTGNAQDKRTIGIELSNFGYLTERDGNLETCYSRLKAPNGSIGRPDIYCPVSETNAYIKTEQPFRGQRYYANFTEEQYNSVIILLRYLTSTYNIPRDFLPEPMRYQTVEGVVDFHGIVSHINYRRDGKWDIGPAFDWTKVIEGVQAAEYHPLVTRSFDAGVAPDIADTIVSEKELEQVAAQPELEVFEDEPYEEIQKDLSQEIEAEDAVQNKPKLYALLVGIGDYRNDIVLEETVRFPRLKGCAKDVEKIKSVLESDEQHEVHITVLTNEQASKKEITRQFIEHLGKAQQGDTALFYYSGHGTQEWADTVWTSDPDGKLECLVCYYDEATQDDFLLADKELRYMIQTIAKNKPHLVTIFDCCHSGENSRNAAMNIAVFEDAIEKRIPFSFKQRDWEKFIFSKEINYDTVKQGEAAALPEGMHIQLSACESNESAMEVAGEGVFTKALLKVLQTTGGDVTYYALRSRIRQYLRNIYEQKPRIYVAGGNDDILYTTFLNRSKKSRNSFGEVVCNDRGIWTMNLGAIQGISLKNKTVQLLDAESNAPVGNAEVLNIKADYSELAPASDLDKSRAYLAHVEGLLSQNVKVFLENVDGPVRDLQTLAETLVGEESIILENDESKADYCVRARNGSYYITRPNDPFRPLTVPAELGDNAAPFSILQQLMHLSQWEFIRNLANEDADSKLSADALRIEIFQVKAAGEVKLDMSTADVSLDYEGSGDTMQTLVKIRLTNTLDIPLYCCMPYLTVWFGSIIQLLNPHVYMIPANTSINIPLEGGALINTLQEPVRLYNWKEQVEHLKFVFSTDEFDGMALSLAELPAPPLPSLTRMVTRGGFMVVNKKKEVKTGWTTSMVTLRFQNPFYNTVRQSDLDAMLADPVTADFALGLYFEANVDKAMQPAYTLKPGIQLVGEKEGEKGFIQDRVIDLANSWARSRRNRHYQEMLKKYPAKVRIVSEGDSWFQHPLVTDIIDHVSRLYPVYCVAAAADTLRNYVSARYKRGEYFLDTLQKEQPSFFLLSGGGNDILGSQFRGYLNENPGNDLPEGEDPRRFLKDSLFDELKSLMDIYRTLFNHLKSEYPQLCVIVHGYDYPVKLNDARKGWLGKYMIEKGIDRPGDRKAAIRLIMDTFNELLKQVADEFAGQVYYLDVRNIVRCNEAEGVDQWYDEIHPNHDGFQQVAMKFIQQLDAIVKERSLNQVRFEEKDVLRDGEIFLR